MAIRKDQIVSQSGLWAHCSEGDHTLEELGHCAKKGKGRAAVGFGVGWSLGEVQMKSCFDGL